MIRSVDQMTGFIIKLKHWTEMVKYLVQVFLITSRFVVLRRNKKTNDFLVTANREDLRVIVRSPNTIPLILLNNVYTLRLTKVQIAA